MNGNSKFLVVLLNRISQYQWFFLVWGLIAFVFVKLIYEYYKKANQSNFKRNDSPPPKRATDLTVVKGGLEKKKDLDS
jgi:hypothetical protein